MPESPNSAHLVQSLPVTSSIPTELPEEQATLFREILTAMEERQVPYAVSELLRCARIRGFVDSPKTSTSL